MINWPKIDKKFVKIEQKIQKSRLFSKDFMLFITFFGDQKIVSIITLTLFSFGFFTNNNLVLKSSINIMIAIVLVSVLKIIFNKKRPNSDYAKKYKDKSFPSGHTNAAIIMMLNLSRLLLELYFGVATVLATLVLICTAFLVALSRIYLKAHYFTDVLAGFAIAITVFLLYCY